MKRTENNISIKTAIVCGLLCLSIACFCCQTNHVLAKAGKVTDGIIQRAMDDDKTPWTPYDGITNIVASVSNRTDCLKLVGIVDERIRALTFDNIPFEWQGMYLWRLKEVYRGLLTGMHSLTDEDCLDIRLKILKWYKQQLERIEKSEPSTTAQTQAPSGAKTTYMAAKRGLHWQWQTLRRNIKTQMDDYVRRYASYIERNGYTEDVRVRARADIEKIIGRRLTDKDLWLDALQRREERKRRAQKEGGTGVNGN